MAKVKQSLHARTAERRRGLVRLARKHKVQAMLVTRVEDVGYLSGFTGHDSWLLVGEEWSAILITDGRYDEQARLECPGLEVFVRPAGLAAAVKECLKGRGVRRLGVQKGNVTVGLHGALGQTLGTAKVRASDDLVDQLRVIKDKQEVRAIERALRVAEQAFMELTGGGAKALIGRTERQIAAELEYRMRMLGADKPSFESIIAAGPNGSKPHYRPRDRVVRKGEAVLIDWGAMVDGYCSDLTRVVFTGTIPPKIAELYEIVLRAQQAGIAALSVGAACKKVDAAARQVVEDGGYGKQFVHGLGHGLGRQVHEAPSLARTSDTRLRCGMVVTVEPGIYLPGVGGVRIEDDVLVARQGPRRLSRLSRDLQAMVLR
mgnify:CR=1 FL=1